MSRRVRFLLVAIASLTLLVSLVALLVDYLQRNALEEEARNRVKLVLNLASPSTTAEMSMQFPFSNLLSADSLRTSHRQDRRP